MPNCHGHFLQPVLCQMLGAIAIKSEATSCPLLVSCKVDQKLFCPKPYKTSRGNSTFTFTNGATYPWHSGTGYITNAGFGNNPAFWQENTLSPHGYSQNSSGSNRQVKSDLTVDSIFGPNRPFKIHNISFDSWGDSRRLWGSHVSLLLTSQSRHYVVHIAHFTQIDANVILKFANGKTLKPGTYLGNALYPLGVSTSKHFHIQGREVEMRDGKVSRQRRRLSYLEIQTLMIGGDL